MKLQRNQYLTEKLDGYLPALNQDIAIKLIKRMKRLLEQKLGELLSQIKKQSPSKMSIE
jgi:hypothetical protein